MKDIRLGDEVLWDFNDTNAGTVKDVGDTHVLVRFEDGFGVWVAKTELTRLDDYRIAIKERVL